jgi:hypothetical protein
MRHLNPDRERHFTEWGELNAFSRAGERFSRFREKQGVGAGFTDKTWRQTDNVTKPALGGIF